MNLKRALPIALLVFAALSSFGKPYWVFFSDKGFSRGSSAEHRALRAAEERLSARCIERRQKAMRGGPVVTFEDIDLCPEYVDALAEMTDIRERSRWLNAVSVDADEPTIRAVSELPFVRDVEPVATFRRERPSSFSLPTPSIGDYGSSYSQNHMLGSPTAHRLGISGDGVLICITDTGFKLDHAALDSSEVVGKYDFICDDTIVSLEPGDPDMSESHGTMTWSVIGGYYPGELVGVGYGASFLLARTEHYTMEDPIEEDYWIAAAEWADSAGVDIVSTSLGYSDWYTPDSMTGDIARISIEADLLAARGICCVICAGNNGSGGATCITAPGDADSIITVGAVDFDGDRLHFSGQGPTADGRIKPEVCALGTGVKAASHYGTTDFRTSTGTSASTPLVAGLAALMLEARPSLLPMEIREAFMMTASNCKSPDNQIGWGIPNIMAAMSYPIGGQSAIALFRGWNLVSLPLADTIDIDVAFPGRIGDVWWWNPDSGAYVDVHEVEPGKGYFVLFSHDTLIVVDGEPLHSISIPAIPGWHAIGGVARTNSLAEMADSSSASLLDGLYLYDSDNSIYQPSNTIPPGRGAFILVSGAGDIRITE